MTREQIIEMAREANVYASHKTGDSNEWHKVRDEHFAALVAAAEREECAQLCEKELPASREEAPRHWEAYGKMWGLREMVASNCAYAIRARGETK